MAPTKEYPDFILEQLSDLDEISVGAEESYRIGMPRESL